MTLMTGEGLPEPFEVTGLAEAINGYDESQAEFFAATASFYKKPTTGNRETLTDSMCDISQSVRKVFDNMLSSDATLEEKARLVTSFLIQDEAVRISFLQGLAPNGKFSVSLDMNDVDEMATDLAGELAQALTDPDEDPVSDLMECFDRLFVPDVNSLLDAAKNTWHHKAKEYGHIASKHLIDVAKLGAGVAIGVWLGNRGRK